MDVLELIGGFLVDLWHQISQVTIPVLNITVPQLWFGFIVVYTGIFIVRWFILDDGGDKK